MRGDSNHSPEGPDPAPRYAGFDMAKLGFPLLALLCAALVGVALMLMRR
ncbi:MAG TPA: hypothetical protein VK416_05555 [Thermoanaerobaculia bacterium]|nr:hypothetical protein [Thermoanaerobaculia bacterium]